MTSDTQENIKNYITTHGQATISELAEYFNISRQMVQRHLRVLLDSSQIQKFGKPPKVLYLGNAEKSVVITQLIDLKLPNDVKEYINKYYLYITPSGSIKTGVEGFIAWCQKTHQPIKKTAQEYVRTSKKYDAYKHRGLIDGRKKLQDTFKNMYLDYLYYLDFYSIERFGKTKLGQQLLYAKQAQDKALIKMIAEEIKFHVNILIKQYHIAAVGFIPPTVKRQVQFMELLPKYLTLTIPQLTIYKITHDIAVPQKTLAKLEDRIENAQSTIFFPAQAQYKNILLIDDAVGSGATLNEAAKKIRQQKLCTGKIIGLALTGSFKGFEVINEI